MNPLAAWSHTHALRTRRSVMYIRATVQCDHGDRGRAQSYCLHVLACSESVSLHFKECDGKTQSSSGRRLFILNTQLKGCGAVGWAKHVGWRRLRKSPSHWRQLISTLLKRELPPTTTCSLSNNDTFQDFRQYLLHTKAGRQTDMALLRRTQDAHQGQVCPNTPWRCLGS